MVGLERGFEPLNKGLKPFAFAGLCHTSDPFLGWLGCGSALFGSLVGFTTWGEACLWYGPHFSGPFVLGKVCHR